MKEESSDMGVRLLETSLVVDLKGQGKSLELPLTLGTEGESAIELAHLREKTGWVTLDPAFMNTASCSSSITFLDGEKGILRYRGYPIEELAQKASFLEVIYLLIHGIKPSHQEIEDLKNQLWSAKETPQGILSLLQNMPPNLHPMAELSSAVMALSSYDSIKDPENPQERKKIMIRLLAQMKNIVALGYRIRQKKPLLNPKSSSSFSGELLEMMWDSAPSEKVQKALEILFILHADHEQNCSTSAVRLVGSSKGHLYAAIASGIQALSGYLHGGANQAVMEMLESIMKDGGNYKKYLEKAKDKSSNFRLMGFGHRVYKNFDPRAKFIKQAAQDILDEMSGHHKDPLLEIAMGLEEAALKDPYFQERHLYPNVDFYSGIIYKALGIPTSYFTVMFALGRLPGWLAQWDEMMGEQGGKIGRPRQIYVGERKRHW